LLSKHNFTVIDQQLEVLTICIEKIDRVYTYYAVSAR